MINGNPVKEIEYEDEWEENTVVENEFFPKSTLYKNKAYKDLLGKLQFTLYSKQASVDISLEALIQQILALSNQLSGTAGAGADAGAGAGAGSGSANPPGDPMSNQTFESRRRRTTMFPVKAYCKNPPKQTLDENTTKAAR